MIQHRNIYPQILVASLACLALVAPASAEPVPEDIDDYDFEDSSLNSLEDKALSEREGM